MSKTIGLITANYASEAMNSVMTDRPLAALPFGGRYRLIDFALSNMTNSGITSVGLVIPFKNRSLIDHVGTGKAWGFGRKTHNLFMLPGSVYGKRDTDSKFLLRDIVQNARFFNYEQTTDYVLMSGSNRVISMDFRPLIKQHEESGVPITKVYKGKEFLDCFIINAPFLNDMCKWFSNLDFMDITKIQETYLPETPVGRYEFVGYEHKIENMTDYFEASMDLLKESVYEMVFGNDRIFTNIQDRCPTFFAPTANVKNSLIAAGSIIEGTVENSIIFRSSHVSEGASVKNCVLMQHAEVDSGAELKYFICDKRVHVTSDVKIIASKESPYFVQKGMTI